MFYCIILLQYFIYFIVLYCSMTSTVFPMYVSDVTWSRFAYLNCVTAVQVHYNTVWSSTVQYSTVISHKLSLAAHKDKVCALELCEVPGCTLHLL